MNGRKVEGVLVDKRKTLQLTVRKFRKKVKKFQQKELNIDYKK